MIWWNTNDIHVTLNTLQNKIIIKICLFHGHSHSVALLKERYWLLQVLWYIIQAENEVPPFSSLLPVWFSCLSSCHQ